MQLPSPTPPSPDLLAAMIRGEQEVIESLIAADPVYSSYVRRHRAERIGSPMGVKEFYSARNELHNLNRVTTPAHARRNPHAYESQCRLIYSLEHQLVA